MSGNFRRQLWCLHFSQKAMKKFVQVGKKALATISKAFQLTYYLCLDLPFPKKSTVGSTYTEYFFFSKSGYYAKVMPPLG